MGMINNLSQSMVSEIFRRLRALENAAPMNNGAVGRGGFEVYDGGVITISNGGLNVTGTATILGTLIASGVINFTGTVTVSGPMSVSGVMTVTNNLVVASGGKITAGTIQLNPDGSAKFGTMTISPAGKITSGSAEINPDGSVKFGNFLIDSAGKVTVANDMTVTTGGKIKVGSSMTLDPSVSSGALVFSNGAQVFTDATTVQMFKGGSVVQIDNSSAKLQATGGLVNVDGAGVRLDGPLRNTSGSTISGVTANVYMDPATGAIKRIV